MKSRYNTFDELYGYCYMVAGTVALMSTPVMGIDPSYKVRICSRGLLCRFLPDATATCPKAFCLQVYFWHFLLRWFSLPTG